jgi:hypothetical protein
MDKREMEYYLKQVRELRLKALQNTEKLYKILQMLP